MFGSTVLEIAIGLMFLYLVLSLVCSKVNEYFVYLVFILLSSIRAATA